MTTIAGVWSERKLESFLETAQTLIGLGMQRGDGVPWYPYRTGAFECAT